MTRNTIYNPAGTNCLAFATQNDVRLTHTSCVRLVISNLDTGAGIGMIDPLFTVRPSSSDPGD